MSREEIRSGIQDMAKRYGADGLADIFYNNLPTEFCVDFSMLFLCFAADIMERKGRG